MVKRLSSLLIVTALIAPSYCFYSIRYIMTYSGATRSDGIAMPTKCYANENKLVEFKNSIKISDVLSSYMNLTNVGPQRFISLCPFHNDINPSLHIADDKGLFHCFSCGASGDVITFVKKKENCEFPIAIDRICHLIGQCCDHMLSWISRLNRKSNEVTKSTSNKKDVLLAAMEHFERNLRQEKNAAAGAVRDYLQSRKIGNKTAARFHIGYSPTVNPVYINLNPGVDAGFASSSGLYDLPSAPLDQTPLIHTMHEQGYSIQDMKMAGMISETIYDNSVAESSKPASWKGSVIRLAEKFSGRLMFPIHDLNGRNVVAFGGRAMELQSDVGPPKITPSGVEQKARPGRPKSLTPKPPKYFPKYLNSAESDSFKKRELLYGYHLAKEHIAKDGFSLLVEGYFDVISLSEMGVMNAVGSLGTAISIQQLELLAKCTKTRKIVVLMDNDDAGITATTRICDRLLDSIDSLSTPIDLRIASLGRSIPNILSRPPTAERSGFTTLSLIKDCADLLVAGKDKEQSRFVLNAVIEQAVGWKIWLIERELDEFLALVVSNISHSNDGINFSESSKFEVANEYRRFESVASEALDTIEFSTSIGTKVNISVSDVLILARNLVQLLKRFPRGVDSTLLAAYVARRLSGGREFVQKRLEFDLLSSMS